MSLRTQRALPRGASVPVDTASRHPTHRPARIVLALVALVIGLVGAPLHPWAATTLPTARADSPTGLVTVTLGQVTPSTLTAADADSSRVTITGTLANTSDQVLTSVQVYLWRDRTPITTAAQLAAYYASDPAKPVGERAVTGATWMSVTSEQSPTLPPGQSASFTVSAPRSLLGFDAAGASYPIGVQVRAVTPDGSTGTVGRARTIIPVVDAGDHLGYTPVVVLSSAPSLLGDATFTDTHLTAEITSPSGRLARLVRLAQRTTTTVLIDPELADELTALAATHRLAGHTQTLAPVPAATTLLDQLTALAHSGRAYRLPYGNADLRLALSSAVPDVISRIDAAVASDNLAASLPLALVCGPGVVSQQMLDGVQALHPALVLAPDVQAGTTAAGEGTVQLLPLTMLDSDAGPLPDPGDTLPQRLGRFLADAQIAGSASPVLVQTSADLANEATLHGATAPVALRTSGASITLPDSGSSADPATWPAAATQAIDAFAAWGEITGHQSAASVRADQTLARSLSASLSGAAARTSFLTRAVALVGSLQSGRQVFATFSPEFVLSSPDNMLPATVTNHLSQSVQVKITFTSENPQRIVVPATDTVTVRAGETVTVHFRPHAYTNGAVTVVAQLSTPEGRPIGDSTKITLRATSLGRVGWIIIIAAGAVFLGLTSIRVRQVRRERSTGRAPIVSSGGPSSVSHPTVPAAPGTPATPGASGGGTPATRHTGTPAAPADAAGTSMGDAIAPGASGAVGRTAHASTDTRADARVDAQLDAQLLEGGAP